MIFPHGTKVVSRQHLDKIGLDCRRGDEELVKNRLMMEGFTITRCGPVPTGKNNGEITYDHNRSFITAEKKLRDVK